MSTIDNCILTGLAILHLRSGQPLRIGDAEKKWITTETGSHIQLDENGTIIAGAGGKFNGKKLSDMGGTKKFTKYQTNAERANNSLHPAESAENYQKVLELLASQESEFNRLKIKGMSLASREKREDQAKKEVALIGLGGKYWKGQGKSGDRIYFDASVIERLTNIKVSDFAKFYYDFYDKAFRAKGSISDSDFQAIKAKLNQLEIDYFA